MTKASRRDFLKGTGAAAMAAAFSPALLFANGSDASERVDDEVGKAYRGWREGEYDVHFIHTGASENVFHIFPDGTTAIFDCGDCDLREFGKVSWNHTKRDDAACEPMPDGSRLPSEWVARYISRLLPDLKKIDYVLASHFHDDHIGGYELFRETPEGRELDYKLSGIANLGEYYRFGKAFDRGYPTYDQPNESAPRERENLRRFFEARERANELEREEFIVGALDQIAPVVAPGKYDFHVRNICRNGVVWSAEENKNVDHFALYPNNKDNWRDENLLSLGTVLQFGKFRYYCGGDVNNSMRDDDGQKVGYETAVGRAAGRVDVCKTNHHASGGSMERGFVDAVQARVYVTCCWWRGHFQPGTTKTMLEDVDGYRGERLLLPTDPHKDNVDMLKDAPYRDRVDQNMGHVVVKAFDGGERFKVYRLTARDESMRVERTFGPFEAQG